MSEPKIDSLAKEMKEVRDWQKILKRARRIGDSTVISVIENVAGFQSLPNRRAGGDHSETPDLMAIVEFNLAVEVLRQHGLSVYRDPEGKWQVQEL